MSDARKPLLTDGEREETPGWFARNALPLQLSGLMLLLVAVYLAPSIFITIDPGQAGVVWHRFPWFGYERGTDVDHVLGEGVRVKAPWDRIYVYNVRMQDITETFSALTKNGLRVEVQITTRFAPIVRNLGHLHQRVGPDYVKLLVAPELTAHARSQIADVTPQDLYSDRRRQLEHALYEELLQEFHVRTEPQPAFFGSDGPRRRRLLGIFLGVPGGLTLAEINSALGLDVGAQQPAWLEADLDLLVDEHALLRRTERNSGVLQYELNPEQSLSRHDLEELISEGFQLLHLEDVLIRDVTLPEGLADAIRDKLVSEQQMLEFDYKLQLAEKEKERKRIEAEGIHAFQQIVAEGISVPYLKWKGIDATLELARSNNAKVVVIGTGADGLPLILGPLDSAAPAKIQSVAP